MNDLKNRLKEIKVTEEKGVDNSESKRELTRLWKRRGREDANDKKIYKKFREHAEEGKERNNNRFRMEYINKLNLNWNILIVLGKKNIGKTYQIHRLIEECIAEDRWVVLLRSTAKECKTAWQPLLEEDISKVKLRQGSNNTYDIIIKPTCPEDCTKRLKKVGFCCSISTLTSYQGSSYPKVKYIIWDECISDGGVAKIRDSDIVGFERFISSIVRDKKDVKTIVFGNLLEKISGMVGDPLLQHYGINPECGCKWIEGKKSHEASVLFINTKEMFTGIDKQGVIGGVDTLASNSLLDNTLTPRGIKTVSMRDFLDSRGKYSLLFTYDTKIVAIHVNETVFTDIPKYLVISIESFNQRRVFTSAVYTNEAPLFNNYSHFVKYVDNVTWSDLIEELNDFCKAGRVIYANDISSLDMNKYMKHFLNNSVILNNENKPWSKQLREI